MVCIAVNSFTFLPLVVGIVEQKPVIRAGAPRILFHRILVLDISRAPPKCKDISLIPKPVSSMGNKFAMKKAPPEAK